MLSLASKKISAEGELDDAIKRIDQQLAEPEHVDEAGSFAQSVAAKMRKFNPYQFALARRNIESALFDVEYGTPCSSWTSATPSNTSWTSASTPSNTSCNSASTSANSFNQTLVPEACEADSEFPFHQM